MFKSGGDSPYIRYVTSLRTLDLSGCSSLVKLPFVCYAPCLVMLNVTGCSSLKEIPSSIARRCEYSPGFILKGWSNPKALPTNRDF